MKFKFAGLEIDVRQSALILYPAAAVVLSLAAATALPIGEAVAAGVLSALLMIVAQIIHNTGHAIAAASTGYPMRGVRFLLLFTFTLYPKDEPELPDGLHIRRALGGVIANALNFALAWALFSATRGAGGVIEWISAFYLIDTAVILFVSGLLSDGVLFIALKGWKRRPARPS